MRKTLSILLILTLASCSLFRGGTAKENAVQALVTTTRSCVLLMTAAGVAYDAGAFGAPGSQRAEDTWAKIAAESLRMNSALNDWTAAIKANKDASAYQSMVAQALAVIGALLPTKLHVDISPMFEPLTRAADLARPDAFRHAVELEGGSR